MTPATHPEAFAPKRRKRLTARHVVAMLMPGKPPRYLTPRGTFRADPDAAARFPGWRAAWQARDVSSFRRDPRVTVLARLVTH